VVGSLVTFTPYSVDALQQIPQSAAWNYGDQGLINDVTVRRNTFNVDPGFAHDVYLRKGYSPKGAFEIKNVNRLLFEGNRHTGYPANWAVTPRNQNGTAPWSTTSNLVFRNNWFAPEDPWRETTGRMAVLSLEDELHTTTPATNIQVYNNFARNVANMIQMKGGNGWTIKHNTVINDLPVANAYHVAVTLEGNPAFNWTFKDNLIGYSNYGMNCSMDGQLSTCWPSGVFQNNAVVDAFAAGFNTGTWGPGGIIGPIQSSFNQVGFLDAANNNYKLAESSPYKRRASDGTDPGVDLDLLLASLGGTSSDPNPFPNPTPTPTPTPTPSPTPSPTPTPAPNGQFVVGGSTFLNTGGPFDYIIIELLDANRVKIAEMQEANASYSFNVAAGGTYILRPRAEGYNANPSEILVQAVDASHGDLNFTLGNANHFAAGPVRVVPPTTPTPSPSPSPVQNTAPTVTLTIPAQGASFVSGSNITLAANAADADGTVTMVEFYRGSTLIGTDSTSPYSFIWPNVATGAYALTAKATDNQGATTTSLIVTIDVNNSPNSVSRAKDHATALANGLNSTPSSGNSNHARSANVVAISDLAALTADINLANQEFLSESSSFGVLAPVIGVQMKAALLFSKATTGLASKINSPNLRNNLLRVATHLAIAEDLMRLGAISQATAAQAIATNTRTNVVIGQSRIGYGMITASSVAPSSLGSIAGNVAIAPMTSQTAFANLDSEGNLPYELGGLAVTVNGVAVPVLYASPSGIKFFMPPDAQLGTAEVIVASQDGYICEGSVNVGRDGSRLMTLADDDNGAAVVTNSRTMTATNFDVETDENFGPDKRTRLTLFATGISGAAVNLDTSNDVTINGLTRPNFAESVSVEARCSDGRVFTLPVEFAGVQGVLPGLDQVNVVLIPELRSAGTVSLTLIINGQRSNAPSVLVH